VLEETKLFTGHHYKLAEPAPQSARNLFARIDAARQAFGMSAQQNGVML
jgi:hypothetical protein